MFINPKRHTKSAFSLLELSTSIIIIALITAGILSSKSLFNRFRIASAQNLTTSSPVNGTKDLTIWLESSLDKSFIESEASDTSSITTWYDIKATGNKIDATQTNSSNVPTYSNTINGIHAVKFDDTTGSYLEISDASFLNNTDYTIFVLEQRANNKADNYFIGDSSNSNESNNNQNLTLGYSADGEIKHSQGGTNSYASSTASYDDSSGKPRIFTFTHSSSLGKKTYINGLLAAENSNTSQLNNITSLRIGNDYTGQIGEIVIFSRSLLNEERKSIEEYMAKKWSSPLIKNLDSCTSGTVTNDGCQATCQVNINGVSTITVNDGSNGSFNCIGTGYNNNTNISYNCSNGTLNITSSPSTCPCASGYVDNGSGCEIRGPITIFLTSVGVNNWIVPEDWNSSQNTIEVIGGGGGGGSNSSSSATGGGGGGYSKITNLSLSPGATITYSVGVGSSGGSNGSGGGESLGGNGGDSWFNGTSLASSSVGAKGGSGGSGVAIGVGGAASSGIGSIKYSGGNGGTRGSWSGGGGGGSAGPNGSGANGGNYSGSHGGGGGGAGGGTAGSRASGSYGGNGGLGANQSGTVSGTGGAGGAIYGYSGANGSSSNSSSGGGGGGGGGNASPPGSGGSGGNGQEWDATHGSGGGGGGSGDQPVTNNTTAVGGSGGIYGGGGGGTGADRSTVGGAGGQGIIVITY